MMENLTRWLAGVEKKAADFYSETAKVFAEDAALAQFLQKLADDEQQHCRLMGKALDILSEKESEIQQGCHLIMFFSNTRLDHSSLPV